MLFFKWGGVCRFCSVDVEDPVDDCGFAVLAFGFCCLRKNRGSGRMCEWVRRVITGWCMYLSPSSQSSATWDILGFWNLAKRLELLQSGKIERHLGGFCRNDLE